MTSPVFSLNRWAVLGVALFGLGCLALIADRSPALALVNESPSLPRGLYLRRLGAPIVPDAVVALAPPPVARAYLADLGMPAEARLIKRVAAQGGDLVCRTGGRVETPRRRAPASLVDRRGRALPQWRGCRRLTRNEVFVLGDTADSFDSRYFGPVRRSDLDGVFVEAATW